MHTAVQLWLSSYNKQEQLRASWIGLLLTLLAYFIHFVIIHVRMQSCLAPGIQTEPTAGLLFAAGARCENWPGPRGTGFQWAAAQIDATHAVTHLDS